MSEPFSLLTGLLALLLVLLLFLPPRHTARPVGIDSMVGRRHLPSTSINSMLHVGRQRASSEATASSPPAADEISRATDADIPAIRRIAERWRIGERSEADLMARGFLVSDFTVDAYQQRVAASDYCFVARRDGQVVGFLLAYSQETLKQIDDTTADWVATRIDDFVVIKQVAVDPDHVSSGVGAELYMHLISHLRGRGARLVAAVVDTPPNVRSHAFHRRMGFTEAFAIKHADGRTRRIWLYRTVAASDEVLAAQYDVAVRLYTHEDTLNWDKLRNYLYVTIMTAAAIGFLMGQPETAATYDPAVVSLALGLVGLATSLGFAISLRSGVAYLAMRKEAVTELEDMYLNRDGVRVVSRLYRVKPWLRRSPTTWVLRLMPIAGVVIWLIVLAYLIAIIGDS